MKWQAKTHIRIVKETVRLITAARIFGQLKWPVSQLQTKQDIPLILRVDKISIYYETDTEVYIWDAEAHIQHTIYS